MTAAQEREYSDNDLLIGIHRAIEASDFPAVEALLRMLAVQNPRAAQDVLDIVELARTIARAAALAPEEGR